MQELPSLCLQTPPLTTTSLHSPQILLLSWINSNRRQGFNRQPNKSPNPQQQAERGNVQPVAPSPTFAQASVPSSQSPAPPSPSITQDMSFQNQQAPAASTNRKPPYFFREEYSNLIVKGNFMTLAAKPVHVEDGEWLAHQGMCCCCCS